MAKGLHNLFDFVTTDSGELTLLLFKTKDEQLKPHIELEKETNTLWLYRNDDDILGLSGIEPKIITELASRKKLLVCEMTSPPTEKDSEIAYVYEAKLL